MCKPANYLPQPYSSQTQLRIVAVRISLQPQAHRTRHLRTWIPVTCTSTNQSVGKST